VPSAGAIIARDGCVREGLPHASATRRLQRLLDFDLDLDVDLNDPAHLINLRKPDVCQVLACAAIPDFWIAWALIEQTRAGEADRLLLFCPGARANVSLR
jgi:hypothetical protein